MTPYRSANEPEPEVLIAVPLLRGFALRRLLFGDRRPSEVRLERLGGAHRLRVIGTPLVVRGPFELEGESRIDDWRRLFMVLRIGGADETTVTIGATAAESEAAPTREEWFDGALMSSESHLGDLVVAAPKALIDLRDAILATVSL